MSSIPHTMTPVEFDTQLRTLATRAHSRYAGEGARIDRGLVLALNGHVTLHADGTAHVRSETHPEVQYHVAAGHCDCPDGTRAPDGRCKHRYAVCLLKKAQCPAPARPDWYATYLTADGTPLPGIASYTVRGWCFTPEGGIPLANVTLHDLCLLGHVETADTQDATDQAARARAWEIGLLWSDCQG